MKFQKKPVIVEALQFDGTHASIESLNIPGCSRGWEGGGQSFMIPTPTGDKAAAPGDWITKDENGAFDAIKPDVFDATYEAVTVAPVDRESQPAEAVTPDPFVELEPSAEPVVAFEPVKPHAKHHSKDKRK